MITTEIAKEHRRKLAYQLWVTLHLAHLILPKFESDVIITCNFILQDKRFDLF